MWRKRTLLTGSSVLAILLVLGWFAGRSQAPTHFKIVVGLSEGYPDYAREIRQASQLAFDEHPQDSRHSLELSFVNISDANDITSETYEASIIETLLEDSRILGYIGAYSSGEARHSIPVANRGQLPLLSSSATWPGLTKPGYAAGEPGIYYPNGQRNFFRVVPADDVQGIAALRWLRQRGIDNAYVIYSDTVYSRGLAGIFIANATDWRIQVLGQASYHINTVRDERIQQLAQELRRSQPEAVYVPLTWEGRSGELLTALRQAVPNSLFLGSDFMFQDTLPDAQGALADIYATNVTPPTETLASAQAFIKAYQVRYGAMPSDYAVSQYEAVKVLLHAIEQAPESNRKAVLKALMEMQNYTGALGTWSFNAHGDTTLQSIAIFRYRYTDATTGSWQALGVIE